MNNHTVKDNISKVRKEAGLSQAAMAEKLGMSRTAYRNIEKGCTKLISDNLDRIAEVLEHSTEELVLGYAPSKDDARRIEEMQKTYSSRHSETTRKYEDEISKLKNENRTLRNFIEALQDSIRTKDEMIAMLRKIVSERQNP